MTNSPKQKKSNCLCFNNKRNKEQKFKNKTKIEIKKKTNQKLTPEIKYYYLMNLRVAIN